MHLKCACTITSMIDPGKTKPIPNIQNVTLGQDISLQRTSSTPNTRRRSYFDWALMAFCGFLGRFSKSANVQIGEFFSK